MEQPWFKESNIADRFPWDAEILRVTNENYNVYDECCREGTAFPQFAMRGKESEYWIYCEELI